MNNICSVCSIFASLEWSRELNSLIVDALRRTDGMFCVCVGAAPRTDVLSTQEVPTGMLFLSTGSRLLNSSNVWILGHCLNLTKHTFRLGVSSGLYNISFWRSDRIVNLWGTVYAILLGYSLKKHLRSWWLVKSCVQWVVFLMAFSHFSPVLYFWI